MAINNRGDIVAFSNLAGDYVGGVHTPNLHAFLWSKQQGRLIYLGVLPGDKISEALC